MKSTVTAPASPFPEPEPEEPLDPDLRVFCERHGISVPMENRRNSTNSDSDTESSDAEDQPCLDSFDEITEPSDLELFSIFLKEAQYQAQSTEKK